MNKGDVVRVKPRTLLYRTRLLLIQSDPKELKKLKNLFLHLGSFISKEPLYGKVVCQGARIENSDSPLEKKRYIGVKLYNKYGSLSEVTYFTNEELKKVK